jgi:hypothetical protein
MKTFSVLLLSATLFGCVAAYKTAEVTDKFSSPTEPAVYATVGNSIYMPIPAIRNPEMNGFVARDRKTGKVSYAGFFVSLVSYGSISRPYGGANWLAVRSGDEAVFLADDQRVVLKAAGPGKISYKMSGGITQGTSTDYYEEVSYVATPEQFRKIAYANRVEYQLTGTNGVDSYPEGKRPFADSFRLNLQRFYESEIAPHL